MQIQTIYLDKDVIVLNKPPGISVHPGSSVSGPTVVDFLLEKFPEVKAVGDDPKMRPGIVHRLDKDTSGVMVVSRNQKSFEKLKELFQKRLVEKLYWAIVCGRPKERRGVISLPIGRVIKNPLKRGVEENKRKIRGAREAVTEYKVLKFGKHYSLVELSPKTGRMHQLRVHLKAIGHPVVCDKIYGGKNVCCPDGADRQMLHARSLSFSFPEGRRLHFEADVPQDFTVALRRVF
ncbi:MAG: RluA family pseudouridine synthase [Candidatus Sungiibacteriota bacterium]|uniref:Pseudouridine synthase n=1 Tax=Candidatus Sungiibacteriota bacterium TaxID=2750080 RepID=A0A7T5RJY4_9BACT|nr:MAG: RluA family pseudouridine synthase [Candidatus Sungbacteria bacterium]